MATKQQSNLEGIFAEICNFFGIESLNTFQREAIAYIINTGKDLFVNLPTGNGKSMIYHALPVVYSSLCGSTIQDDKTIVVVVSPLNSLIEDQIKRLHSLGIRAISLNDVSSDEAQKELFDGSFSIVFGSPESWLGNEKWRKMVSSNTYRKNVKAVVVDEAHVISHWYVSNITICTYTIIVLEFAPNTYTQIN